MTKFFCVHAFYLQHQLKQCLILILLAGIWFGGCDYFTEPEAGRQEEQTLFPELAPGSYFGELVLAGRRQGVVERLPLLVVVQQSGRLSWSIGEYSSGDNGKSYSGVANLLLPLTVEVNEGMVELAWNRPRCGPGEQCSSEKEAASRWHGDVVWRGVSGKTKSIAVVKDNAGRIGAWFLKPLIDDPERVLKGTSGSEDQGQTTAASVQQRVAERSDRPPAATAVSPPVGVIPAVQRFDLAATLRDSGFCSLSEGELNVLIEKFQSERKTLAKQLYYTAKATPAGRLVWLSRLLLSQESLKIKPVAEVAAAPVIDNEIEAERKRLAALQALGIE